MLVTPVAGRRMSRAAAVSPPLQIVTRPRVPGAPATSTDTTNGSSSRTSAGAVTLVTATGLCDPAASSGTTSMRIPAAAASAASRAAWPAVSRPSDISTMRRAPSRGSAARAVRSASSMFVPAPESVDATWSTLSASSGRRSIAASSANATSPARSGAAHSGGHLVHACKRAGLRERRKTAGSIHYEHHVRGRGTPWEL